MNITPNKIDYDELIQKYFELHQSNNSGSHTHTAQAITNHPNRRNGLFEQDFVIGLKLNGDIEILKSRLGYDINHIQTDSLIQLFSRVLVRHFFGDKMKLFEETLEKEVVNSIRRTLIESRGTNESS
jgi:hypothetical protein